MSYTKHPYVFGYTVTVDDMKDMDNGIFNNDAEITKIKNGQTTVNKAISANSATSAGDAAKLGGHPASDFATTATVTALSADVDRHAFGEQSGSRNLWNEVWTNRNIRGTVGEKFTPLSGDYVGNLSAIELKPSTKYVFCKTATSYVYFYDASMILIQNYTTLSSGGNQEFTTPSNTKYMYFLMATTYGTAYKHDLAIIEGTSGTYEPYIKSNAILTEESIRTAELQALGWCVPSEMPIKNSFVNGVLTQRVARVLSDDLSWSLGSYNGNLLFDAAVPIPSVSGTKNMLFGQYIATSSYGWGDLPNGYMRSYGSGLRVKDSSCSSVNEFKIKNEGKYLYFELATPITHNITDMPSQKSMISDEWDSTKTYSVGAYAIYQNRLYKCLVQNSGQNPSTSPTYWQMVKVTDIIGSGGNSYRKLTAESSGAVRLTSCNEVLVVVGQTNDSRKCTITIPYAELLDEGKGYMSGFYASSSANSAYCVTISKSTVTKTWGFNNGSQLSDFTMNVYVK